MTSYQTTQPGVLEAALDPARDNLLIVDYDETLWLRNSTEEFLSSVRPAWMVAALLWGLGKLRPWRLVGGRGKAHIYKDWIRTLTVVVVMPWSLAAWARTAPRRGRIHANARLEAYIANSGASQVVVLSNGYHRVITPLLSQTLLKNSILLASPILGGARWRKRGKRKIAEAHFSAEQLDRATLITDHIHDLDLLSRVGNGVLCVWPNARYRRAFRPRKQRRVDRNR